MLRVMYRATTALTFAVIAVSIVACRTRPAAVAVSTAPGVSAAPEAVESHVAPSKSAAQSEPLGPSASSPTRCSAADWSAQPLAPLLKPGKTPTPSKRDRQGAAQLAFAAECTDAPGGPTHESPAAVVIDGVEIRLAGATPAGSSRRGWDGNQCAFDVRLADGGGASTRLGAQEIPPFTTVSAVVRSGSAAWLSVSFNGYSAEFPKGGNRIFALDLCDGRVVWQSKDSMSNGGLLLLDGYLISPFGFTNERRYVFVLDARSGSIIQKLPVIENICPSKSWAPNWHPGERCDAPGQAVGAATAPRIEGGLFLVDTNTGSSAFQFK